MATDENGVADGKKQGKWMSSVTYFDETKLMIRPRSGYYSDVSVGVCDTLGILSNPLQSRPMGSIAMDCFRPLACHCEGSVTAQGSFPLDLTVSRKTHCAVTVPSNPPETSLYMNH